MKKYLEIAKVLFRAQLVYRFDVMMTALGMAARVLFAFILWGAVFTERETVGNFTYEAMLSYYLVSSFLASVEKSGGVSGEVSQRIRGGTFSKYMVIPDNPMAHFLAQTLGSAGYYAVFSALTALFCALAFGIAPTFSRDLAALACAALMVPVGLVFMVCYQYFIGLLAFKFQDIGFFWHVQGAILQFATGGIVPLSLLPEPAVMVFRFLPFTYVTYAPAMLLTGQMQAAEGLFGLAVLSAWTVGMVFIGQYSYQRLRVRYDGVGI